MMKKLLFYTLLCFGIGSCSKDGAGGLVEVYFLKNTPPPPRGCMFNFSNAVLDGDPFIKNDDIYAYSPTDHVFTISDEAARRIDKFGDNLPFALTVNKEPVYYGLLKSMVSSSVCSNVITMYYYNYRNEIAVNAANPGASSSTGDPRNDNGLMVALRRQRKLR